MKAIELYYDLMKTGKLQENNGLCSEIDRRTNAEMEQEESMYEETLELFSPSPEDIEKFPEAFDRKGEARGYWGSDEPYPSTDSDKEFGPTRQTILLFIAAIHEEI